MLLTMVINEAYAQVSVDSIAALEIFGEFFLNRSTTAWKCQEDCLFFKKYLNLLRPLLRRPTLSCPGREFAQNMALEATAISTPLPSLILLSPTHFHHPLPFPAPKGLTAEQWRNFPPAIPSSWCWGPVPTGSGPAPSLPSPVHNAHSWYACITRAMVHWLGP